MRLIDNTNNRFRKANRDILVFCPKRVRDAPRLYLSPTVDMGIVSALDWMIFSVIMERRMVTKVINVWSADTDHVISTVPTAPTASRDRMYCSSAFQLPLDSQTNRCCAPLWWYTLYIDYCTSFALCSIKYV